MVDDLGAIRIRIKRAILTLVPHQTAGPIPHVALITVQHVGGPVAEHPFDFFFGPDGPRSPGGPPSERQGAGTGFLIDANGYIVTNEHVVRNADEVTVKLADDRELPAELRAALANLG